MAALNNFTLQATVFFLVLLSHSFAIKCDAQSRVISRSANGKATSGSPRPTKQPLARLTSSRNTVRSVAASQKSATLAPAAVNGANEPLSLMESQAEQVGGSEALMDQSVTDFDASNFNGCDSCGGQNACCCTPLGFLVDWRRAELWAGAVGFTVPANFLNTASNSTGANEGAFGFQEGINFGTRVPSVWCGQVGSQVGVRFVHSQLDGSAAGVDRRQQVFLTGGFFRRVDYGVQGGVVVDYLHDDWVYKADLLQLRGELSYLLSPCHELGFRFTDSQQIDDTSYRLRGSSTTTNVRITSLDTYRGFYRCRFSEQARSLAELHAGWTEDSGALLGLSLQTPLQNQIGLNTSVTYLMPPSDATPSFASEGWNLSLTLVWTPGRPFGHARDYYRPLFEVADNATMISKID